MYELFDRDIPAWRIENNRAFPAAIDLICPRCGRKVTFAIPRWESGPVSTIHAQIPCPACHGHARFLLADKTGGERSLAPNAHLYVYPPPSIRQPISGVSDIQEFSEPLRKAYESAVNVFNVREWNATAVLSRRLLEGITKSILRPEQQNLPLARQLALLPESRDLSKPILSLADAIRKGGNLGAHFDLLKEPDEMVAALMLELIEDLIEYLFILPRRIDELHSKIEALSNNPTDEAS